MRAASIPAASATTSASASTAWVQPTIIWLIILAASPAPTGPITVKRWAMSAISGRTASMSSGLPRP